MGLRLKYKYNIPQYYLETAKEIYIKKIALEKSLANIRHLFFGSSHLDCCFLPSYLENSFNIGIKSIDLYYIFKIYELYANKMKNLQNIFLFYSPFFTGWDLAKTSHFHYCIFYKKIFGIDYRRFNFGFLLKENYYNQELKKIIKYIPKNLLENNNGFLNYMNYGIDPENYKEDVMFKKILSAIRENIRRDDESFLFLERLVKLSRENKHNFFIVLPSYSEFYKKMMPDKKVLFRSVYKLVQSIGEVNIIDLYDDKYLKFDLMDQEHFNFSGAEKFTKNFVDKYVRN